jgi:hypothetical protein
MADWKENNHQDNKKIESLKIKGLRPLGVRPFIFNPRAEQKTLASIRDNAIRLCYPGLRLPVSLIILKRRSEIPRSLRSLRMTPLIIAQHIVI